MDLIIGKQIFQEITNFLDHAERQELVNVTVRCLDLVVQVLATVFETKLLCFNVDFELSEVLKRGALLSLLINLCLDIHQFITEHFLKAAIAIDLNTIFSHFLLYLFDNMVLL